MSVSHARGPAPRPPVQRQPGPGSLAELINVILDKGIVIDAWARVSVVGIEILTIEARVVVASVETYLRYAEAIGLTALAIAGSTAARVAQVRGSAIRTRRTHSSADTPGPAPRAPSLATTDPLAAVDGGRRGVSMMRKAS